MRLLIVTQGVDRDDPVLGFFHAWIREFSKHAEKVHVICLKEGTHDLPKNVSVHSLGKESGRSRIKYVARLFRYVQGLYSEYDVVLVHQNQEYILLAGWLWLAMRKPIFMWRNHYAGNFFTDVASLFCTRVFCTSRYSYTARYKKTRIMPVGIDTEILRFFEHSLRTPRSILSLGRIAPSKRLDVFVEALILLKQRGVLFSADIYGDALPEDAPYAAELKRQVVEARCDDRIQFHEGVPNAETPALYGAHEYFVNIAGSGMLDKTIFEAMAFGALPVTSNKNLHNEIDQLLLTSANPETLADDLEELFTVSDEKKEEMRKENRRLAEKHGLPKLVDRLISEMT